MSSPGTGSDISKEVLSDLLHKLITESKKVQVLLSCPSLGVTVSLSGLIRVRGSDGTLWVMDADSPREPKLSFDPFVAVVRKYGDNRSLPPTEIGAPRFASALTFLFDDGSTLGIFELEEEGE